MSIRFLIATIFFFICLAGGIMTSNGYGALEVIMMLGGFFGAAGTLFLPNNSKWNKKLWKW